MNHPLSGFAIKDYDKNQFYIRDVEHVEEKACCMGLEPTGAFVQKQSGNTSATRTTTKLLQGESASLSSWERYWRSYFFRLLSA